MGTVIAIIHGTLNRPLRLSSGSLSRSATLKGAEKEFVSRLGHLLNIYALAAVLGNVSRLVFTGSWETVSAVCL